jgi:flavin reductase (DIM6/NTAB) family NADH-FMN oxidoreductase RutF
MAEILGQEGTVFLCYSTSSTTLRSVQQRVGEWSPLVTGVPVLDGALVSFDYHVTEVVKLATHSVYFGAGASIASRSTTRPLIYAHGTYGTFSPEGAGLWW